MNDKASPPSRFTLNDLRSEKDKVRTEQQAAVVEAKAAAARINESLKIWPSISKRLKDAVTLTDRLARRVGVKIRSNDTATATPSLIRKNGCPHPQLPGVEVLVDASGSKAGHKSAQLWVGIGELGLESRRANYLGKPGIFKSAILPEVLDDDGVETIVVDFLNDGVLGLPSELAKAIPAEISEPTPDEGEGSTGELPPSTVQQIKQSAPKALRDNSRAIDLTAAGLLQLLDARIESLGLPNSDDGKAELQSLQDLKTRIEAFLEAAHQFLADAAKQLVAVDKTISLAQGAQNFWNARHEEICTKLLDGSVFGSLLTLCLLAGATGNVAAIVPAMIVGGKPVAEVLANWAKRE
jgi:hypothetical protein